MENKHIFVVDDEKNICELIKKYLIKEGYTVDVFHDGKSAYDAFITNPPDMFVIDVMMTGMDGFTLCREIRKKSNVPIIIVSAKGDEIDRILGLELGSDDYISKPFSVRELIVRIKTIFRRMSMITNSVSGDEKSEQNIVKCCDITFLPDERRALKEEIELDFTAKEYDFLCFLSKNKNRIFNREQLINNIWGYEYIGDTRAIDDLVKRVRKKLAKVESNMEIVTVWGFGYKIVDRVNP